MNGAGWAILLIIGLMLIVVGATGRLGSGLGALITPAHLIDTK